MTPECPCGHHWNQHDAWGCQRYLCRCRRIDALRVFDLRLRRAVDDPLAEDQGAKPTA